MSLELHEWDIHIVCRGTDDASGACGAAADNPRHHAGNFRHLRSLGEFVRTRAAPADLMAMGVSCHLPFRAQIALPFLVRAAQGTVN
jgi:hypothetical protein